MSNDEMDAATLAQLSDLYSPMTDIDQAMAHAHLTDTEILHMLVHLDDTPANASATPWELGAIYARVSSETQDSLEAQTEACLRRAEIARISVPTGWRFAEKASGLVVSRTEYQKMMDLARRGQIKHIIVFLPDRLGRDAGAFISDMRALERLGVRVHTHIGEIPWEMVPFLGIMNEYYCRNLSGHVANGQESRARAGQVVSQLPYGYTRIVDGVQEWEIDERVAPIIRGLFERLAHGDSMSAVGQWFNEQSGDNNRPLATLRKMVANPIYMGLYRYRTQPRGKFTQGKPDKGPIYTPFPHLQIVEPRLWLAAWQTYRARHANPGYARTRTIAHPLAGLLSCAHCVRVWRKGGPRKGLSVPEHLLSSCSSRASTNPRYSCPQCRGGRKARNLWAVLTPVIFDIPCGEAVRDAMRHLVGDAGDPRPRMRALHEKIGELRDEKAELIRHDLDPASRVSQIFGGGDFDRAIVRIDNQLAEMQRDLPGIEAEADTLAAMERGLTPLTKADVWKTFPGLTIERQHGLLAECIEMIYLDWDSLQARILWKSHIAVLVGRESSTVALGLPNSRFDASGVFYNAAQEFSTIRMSIHGLGLRTSAAYRTYVRQHPEADLPLHPYWRFKAQWKGWDDFLGSATPVTSPTLGAQDADREED